MCVLRESVSALHLASRQSMMFLTIPPTAAGRGSRPPQPYLVDGWMEQPFYNQPLLLTTSSYEWVIVVVLKMAPCISIFWPSFGNETQPLSWWQILNSHKPGCELSSEIFALIMQQDLVIFPVGQRAANDLSRPGDPLQNPLISSRAGSKPDQHWLHGGPVEGQLQFSLSTRRKLSLSGQCLMVSSLPPDIKDHFLGLCVQLQVVSESLSKLLYLYLQVATFCEQGIKFTGCLHVGFLQSEVTILGKELEEE